MGLSNTILGWFLPAAGTGRGFSGVPYVIDGDTLAFGRKRVRIWGIDAPEMDTWPGKQARLFLIEKLSGQRVTCIETGERSYGRIVAKCFVDGEDIAWWLVNAGHAIDWPRFSGGHYRSGTSHELRRFIIAYRRRYREFAPTRSDRSVTTRR